MLNDIRDGAFSKLYDLIKKDRNIILISVDQGAQLMNKIEKDFPKNFLKFSISEQNAINFAAGLSKEGFKPYVYLISPFIARAYEQIKINISSMKLKINIIGSGSGYAYASDGVTHYFLEDYGIFNNLPNINLYSTHDYLSANLALENSYKAEYGGIIKLEKGQFYNLKKNYNQNIDEIKKGNKILLVSYGYLAQKISKEIMNNKIFNKDDLGFATINKLIPLDINRLKKISKKYKKILFVEETNINSSVFQSLNDKYLISLKAKNYLQGLFAKKEFVTFAGSRDDLLKSNHLDINRIIKKIKSIL
tara:strand:+ start:70 stop:987 length:918 start_codon:yes stop_codon:yes gene_type:complete